MELKILSQATRFEQKPAQEMSRTKAMHSVEAACRKWQLRHVESKRFKGVSIFHANAQGSQTFFF